MHFRLSRAVPESGRHSRSLRTVTARRRQQVLSIIRGGESADSAEVDQYRRLFMALSFGAASTSAIGLPGPPTEASQGSDRDSGKIIVTGTCIAAAIAAAIAVAAVVGYFSRRRCQHKRDSTRKVRGDVSERLSGAPAVAAGDVHVLDETKLGQPIGGSAHCSSSEWYVTDVGYEDVRGDFAGPHISSAMRSSRSDRNGENASTRSRQRNPAGATRQSVESGASFDSGLSSMAERDTSERKYGYSSFDDLFSVLVREWTAWVAHKERRFRTTQLAGEAGVTADFAEPIPSTAALDDALRECERQQWCEHLLEGSVCFTQTFAVGKFGETGGELQVAGGSAKLVIPRGALRQCRLLYLGVVYEEDAAAEEEANFTPVYECGPSGLAFSEPLRLEVLHCAYEECAQYASAYVRDDSAGPWSSSPATRVEYKHGGRAVLFVEHFTGFRLATDLSRNNSAYGSGHRVVVTKNIYLCLFKCPAKIRLYYLNGDDCLYEKICEHEKRSGSEIGSPKVPFTFHDIKGPLVVEASQSAGGVTASFPCLFKGFEAKDVLRNTFDYTEISCSSAEFEVTVRQEFGGITCVIVANQRAVPILLEQQEDVLPAGRGQLRSEVTEPETGLQPLATSSEAHMVCGCAATVIAIPLVQAGSEPQEKAVTNEEVHAGTWIHRELRARHADSGQADSGYLSVRESQQSSAHLRLCSSTGSYMSYTGDCDNL